MLAGEAEFEIDGDVFRAGPGSFVAAPPGVLHGFRNAGGVELRMLNIHAPNVGFAERLAWVTDGPDDSAYYDVPATDETYAATSAICFSES